MNPFGLDATSLMVWGLVAHLIADWPLQSDWMAKNKASLRHPAGYVHAGLHGLALALVFGWVAAPLALSHLLIDTRKPVAWFSKVMRQTQPGTRLLTGGGEEVKPTTVPLMDVGMEVRFWVDQVWHVACIAIAALLVTA